MATPQDVTHLGVLPEATPEPHVAVLVKRYKYISLVLRAQAPHAQGNALVLTLHQGEVRKLARALLEVADAPVQDDFVDEAWFGTEGVYLGGPPRRDQLVEFNPSLLNGARDSSR